MAAGAGAGILANGVTEILKKLSFVVANEITLVWDFKDELKNLQTTLNMILALMEDAEKKQVSDALVRLWMEELKSTAYDADDILDEYAYEVNLCKLKKEDKSTTFNQVRSVFSSSKPSFVCSWKVAHKVKKINAQFQKIANRKNDLSLQIINMASASSNMNLSMKNRETYSSLVQDWKIIGRENDKSTIIKMLLEEENSSIIHCGGGKNVSVIPIVGMGGLGKTFMAQQVFNDESVKRHFDIKVWICVSDPFDVKMLFKNIGKSLDENVKYDDGATMESIVGGVEKNLRGKKFLLVLDDVWNENPADWNKLRTPLLVGAQGSKILVTTRNIEVASIMRDRYPPYPLGILNENDCWSLFKELAFGSVGGPEETPILLEMGREMVNRCKGLPLAVIFLGRLMRSKKKEDEWKIIRDTELWHESREGKTSKNEILPSLRLSYDYLPSHLKQCFSYCCLFPKDSIIEKSKLIRLWMAEGFLIRENTIKMEEIGNRYFRSLLSNFFFQDVVRNNEGQIKCYKMHDLVHDLALSVVGNNEYLIIKNTDDIERICEATRHLSLVHLVGDIQPKFLEALKNAKNLRSVLAFEMTSRFDIGNALKKNRRLRVLDLSMSDTKETSFCIGKLKHLRYLYTYGVTFQKRIGRLSFLQTLDYFDVGSRSKKRNANVIQELGGLNLLRGELRIDGLENVTSERDACNANLNQKNNLRGLTLTWTNLESCNKDDDDDDDGNNNHEVVLEQLQPHPNLRNLTIKGFMGSKLPRWMEDSSCLPNLLTLNLYGCTFEELVGFGALPSLWSLIISGYNKSLESIGKELYYSSSSSAAAAAAAAAGSTTISFPSLKYLDLLGMESLKEWVVPSPSTTTSCYCFPLLEEITISGCPLLTRITPTTTIFPSLKVLKLDNIDGRAAQLMVINNLHSLTSLTLNGIPNLISLPYQGVMANNNTLLSLVIINCPDFKGFLVEEDEEDLNDDDQEGGEIQLQVSSTFSLHYFKLYDCPVLRFFPDIRSLTSLRELEIQDSKASRSLQDELTCLSSSSLEHLEYVKIWKYNTAGGDEEEEEEEEEEERNEQVIFEWRKSS